MRAFDYNNEAKTKKTVLELKVFDNDTINLKVNGTQIHPTAFKIEGDMESLCQIHITGNVINCIEPITKYISLKEKKL